MKLYDLDYIVFTQDKVGGAGYCLVYPPICEPEEPSGSSFAAAIAKATAVGTNTIAKTFTSATAVPGGASAFSASVAKSY